MSSEIIETILKKNVETNSKEGSIVDPKEEQEKKNDPVKELSKDFDTYKLNNKESKDLDFLKSFAKETNEVPSEILKVFDVVSEHKIKSYKENFPDFFNFMMTKKIYEFDEDISKVKKEFFKTLDPKYSLYYDKLFRNKEQLKDMIKNIKKYKFGVLKDPESIEAFEKDPRSQDFLNYPIKKGEEGYRYTKNYKNITISEVRKWLTLGVITLVIGGVVITGGLSGTIIGIIVRYTNDINQKGKIYKYYVN